MKKTSSEIKKITFSGFKMYNKDGESFNNSLIKSTINCYILADGTIRRKPLFTKVVSLEDAHSIFPIQGSLYFVCGSQDGNHWLFVFDSKSESLTRLFPVPPHRLWYVVYDRKIFMSNILFKKIYDIDTQTFIDWVAPAQIPIDVASDASEYSFIDIVEFPACNNIVLFAGRIFGVRDNQLHYTEPVFMTFTKPYNYIEFDEPIIAISSNDDFLLAGTESFLYVISVNNMELFSLKINSFDIGCVPNGIASLYNKFIICCKDGIRLYSPETKEFALITNNLFKIGISTINGISKLPQDSLLINSDLNNFEFYDNVTVEVIKNINQ